MRPKIGLILLRAEWFDSVVALPELTEGMARDAEALQAALPAELELEATWVVNSGASLSRCAAELRAQALDLAVLAFQVWAEDFYLQPLIEAIGRTPLAVWCYQPSTQPPRPASFVEVLRYSGLVGTLEGLGTLRNLGARFAFLAGAPGSARLNAELGAEAQAGALRQALGRARFGLLPGRNEQMQSTFVDEFRLRADLGPTVELLSVGELAQAAGAVPQAELERYLAELRRDFPVKGVSPETLERAARATLGLGRLARDRRLDLLSMNDISAELHQALGLRPCFYPPQSADGPETLYGLEGDLGAATAVFVLQRLTGSPVFFTEFWFWDEATNLMVGGHAGLQDPRCARPGEAWISHDFEFCQSDATEGAHFQFACRPGRVTLLQVRWTPNGWQTICAGGEVADMPPWIEGYPHAILRPDVEALEFIRQAAEVGTTQHWAIAYGDARAAVRAWCRLENVALKEIG
jgi:L-fucose isomerase-like protein